MSTFWNVIILLFTFSLISCEQADFYKKPELISQKFKDDFYPTTHQQPTDDEQEGDGTIADGDLTPDPIDVDPITIDPDPSDEEYVIVTETFVQNVEQQAKVDILWVVDNSGSMGNEQDSLAYNFDIFIHDFLQKNVDFQMGITTTDVTAEHIGEDYQHALNFLSAEQAQNDQDKFVNDFKKLITVGTGGSWEEQGLKAMEAYLAANHVNAQNKPFLRDDAYLAVVIISDEEEQSSENAQHYVDLLKQYKHHDGWAKVYSIVTVDDQNRHQWETVGQKYMDVANATHGQVQDIQNNFYDVLQDMGNSIVDLTKSFALSRKPADSSTITVSVAGVENQHWTYDTQLNAVVFDTGREPAVGSQIIVQFKVLK